MGWARREDQLSYHRAYYRTHRDKMLADAKAYAEAHPGEARERRLSRQYGLTAQGYDQLLLEQGGGCAICHSKPSTQRRLAVDHDHTSGAVRGLLCGSCNTAIGSARDNPELLGAMIAYLLSAKGQ